MDYVTRAKIEEIWGAEYVSDILPEDVDADLAIATAIGNASDQIDIHLSARYSLPLSSAPSVLAQPCADITLYILANRHTALTQTIEDRYKAAVELLQRIAEGKAGLGAGEPRVDDADPDTSTDGASFSADPRLFGRGAY